MSESASQDSSQVPGRAQGGETPTGGTKGVRNMADVARLFLDGARPLASNGSTASKRLGPNDRVVAKPAPATHQPIQVPARPVQVNKEVELPPVLFAMCGGGGSGETNWKLLCGVAESLAAEHSTTVCVVGERNGVGELVMEVVGGESESDVPRLAPGAGSADLQVGRAMYALRGSVGTWLVAAPESASALFGMGLKSFADWLVVTPTTNAGIVGIYQQMKRALGVMTPAKAMRAFVVGDDADQAKTVFGRLEEASRAFLKQELSLMGVGSASDGGVKAAGISMGQEDRSGVWAALFDELSGVDAEDGGIEEMDVEKALDQVTAATKHVEAKSEGASAASHAVFDQLSHVLDPEEREALSAELEEVSPEAFDIRDEVVSPVLPQAGEDGTSAGKSTAVPTQAHVERIGSGIEGPKAGIARALPSEIAPGMRVFDLPNERSKTRSLEWDAVESSVSELMPGSILLEARPPMSWATECCLAVDVKNGGRLNVWTLYKNGVSWYGLREWAGEHRRILALTRRDLVMDQTGEVAVHIVMPMEMEAGSSNSAAVMRDLLRTPSESVVVYRIREIMWGPRRGMVVVPMA